MKQRSCASVGLKSMDFSAHGRVTRKAKFLIEMDALMPWQALCELIEPHYLKAGNGRPPVGLERMLRIHFLQLWFNLADEACEEALYDKRALFDPVDQSHVICSRALVAIFDIGSGRGTQFRSAFRRKI